MPCQFQLSLRHKSKFVKRIVPIISIFLMVVSCSDDTVQNTDQYETVENVLFELANAPYELKRETYFKERTDGTLIHDSTDYIHNYNVYFRQEYDEGGRVFEVDNGDTSEYLFTMTEPRFLQSVTNQGVWVSFEIIQISASTLILRSDVIVTATSQYVLEREMKRP